MNVIDNDIRQEIPFVRILLPFAAGIICFYDCNFTWVLYGLLFSNAFIFIDLLLKKITWLKSNIIPFNIPNGFIIHLLFFLTGSLCATLYNDHNHTDYYLFKQSKYIKIRIISEPQNRPNIILFNAEVTRSMINKPSSLTQKSRKYSFHHASGKIRVVIMKNESNSILLKYGDELIIPANLSEIPAPLNPYEFDFKSWQAMQNIHHQIFLKAGELVKMDKNKGNKFISFVLQLREKQVAAYRRLIKNDDAFAIASTLILGYRAELSAEIMDTYSKTGTIHVLSVSGMHVGLVYLVLSRLLWFLKAKPGNKVFKALLILSAIWFYTLLTGFSPSVLRAAIMISVFIVAKQFNKNTNSYNIIAFAAFCLLVYNPFLIWDVGFQLSFMAVLGLVYVQPKIQQWLPVKQSWLNAIWSLIAMSLAAQLATYPFSVYYFHQFPVYFLLSNLFITLPAALIMYIGIIILIFKLDFLAPIFEWLIRFTNDGLAKIAAIPNSGITAIWISKTELMLLSLSLLIFIIACAEFRKRLLIYSLMLFIGFQSLICYDKLRVVHQKSTLTFVLKNNYAIALISAHRAILFTDLTPQSKAFAYFVKPALDQHRVTQITFRQANVTRVLKDNLIFDQLN